jgi:hypothetical protein
MSETESSATVQPQSTASSVKAVSAQRRFYMVQDAAAKLNLPPSWLYERTWNDEIPFRQALREVYPLYRGRLGSHHCARDHEPGCGHRERSIENARPAWLHSAKRRFVLYPVSRSGRLAENVR